MKDLSMYGWIALILVLIGGINWGLVGLFNMNIISAILGSILSRILFIIIGLAALYICYLLYLDRTKKI
jgi:uncharacterized protein